MAAKFDLDCPFLILRLPIPVTATRPKAGPGQAQSRRASS